MTSPVARTSIARRVVVGASASAALGALVAALLTIFVVDRNLAQQTDQRLLGAVDVLAEEVDEVFEEQDSLVSELAEENAELVTSGIRLAVYQGRELLAGDPWVPNARGVRCVTRGKIGARLRACGKDHAGLRLVAGQAQDDVSLRFNYLVAGTSAVLVAVFLGWLASLVVTRWATASLRALAMKVTALPAEARDSVALGPASELAEIEALRFAIASLLARSHEHLKHVERFAADAAHELCTPLAILRGELELMAEEATGPTREQARSLARRAERLSDLVERLLVLATPTPRALAFQPVSLSEIASTIVTALPQEQRARVELEASDEALVTGDAALLGQLLRNALDNALKFSRDPVSVRVIESAGAAADAPTTDELAQVVLEVCDSGPGIPTALRARVFEPFFRERADAAPGHGLGLALVLKIAAVHGGQVELLDAAPGTRLVVTLPRLES